MAKKAILIIDDLAPDRELVTVFGKDYELLAYEDMGLVKYSKFLKKYAAIGDDAENASELEEKEFEAFESSLNEMVKTVLVDIPEDVVKRIPIEKKQKVVACFFTVATKTLTAKSTEAKRENQPTTET